jgi:hypothetical protein
VKRARLLTALRVIPSSAADAPWEVFAAGRDRKGSPRARAVEVTTAPGALRVRELVAGRAVFSAVCRGGVWSVGTATIKARGK